MEVMESELERIDVRTRVKGNAMCATSCRFGGHVNRFALHTVPGCTKAQYPLCVQYYLFVDTL